MKKTRKMLLLTVLVASIAWPSEGARLPVTGVIYGGYWRSTQSCIGFNDLQFAGRMPAGHKTYTVVAGSSADDCDYMDFYADDPPRYEGELNLVGETPSGAFHWDCEGRATWRRDTTLEDLAEDLDDPFGLLSGLDGFGVGHAGFVTYNASCATQGFAPRFVFRMVLALGGNTWGGNGGFTYPAQGVYWVKG